MKTRHFVLASAASLALAAPAFATTTNYEESTLWTDLPAQRAELLNESFQAPQVAVVHKSYPSFWDEVAGINQYQRAHGRDQAVAAEGMAGPAGPEGRSFRADEFRGETNLFTDIIGGQR